MKRIPEEELMDGFEQVQAYAEADFDEANTLFVDSFQQCFGEHLKGRGLDLGCGPADIVCRLAELNPEMKFDAVDGSEAMLAWAERSISRKGLAKRINLLNCYLPCHDLPVDRYAVITSNSLLHHMREPHDFWQMIANYSEPGTKVMVMDLLRPADTEAAHSLVNQHAADAPEILRADFYNSLLAAYRPDEIEKQLDMAVLKALQVQVVSDRHWLVSGQIG